MSGSRPPPLISWTLGSKKMESTFIHTSFNGNVTTTSVSFDPRPEHHGSQVSCHAVNPAFPDDVLVEKWNLIVHCEFPVRTEVLASIGSRFSNPQEFRFIFSDAPIVDLYPCHRSAHPIPPENTRSRMAGFVIDSSSSLCLRCTILANPAPSSIRWYHSNEVMATNM